MRNDNLLPALMVGSAAALWGCIGFFTEYLTSAGFTSLQLVTLRAVMATILLFLFLRLYNPELLHVERSDYRYFIGTGIVSITFFNWCYFTAINETSLSVAVILLYTGPAFVVILSAFLFKENLTLRKGIALAFTFIGVELVSGLFPSGASEISFYGLLTGLGAGFGYALYSIFSKFALKKYPPLTIIFYTFLFASLFLIPFTLLLGQPWPLQTATPGVLFMIVGLGLIPTALAYMLYTEGLRRMEAGKASITAMIEPATAAIIGVAYFGEDMGYLKIAGIVLVLLSVTALYVKADPNGDHSSQGRLRI